MGQSRFEGILETLCWCPILPKRGRRDLTDEQWSVVEPVSEGCSTLACIQIGSFALTLLDYCWTLSCNEAARLK